MTDLRDAARQALEALEAMQSYAAAERKGLRICDEAITALRAALEQPEQQQEPVKRAQHAPEESRRSTANPPAVYKDEGIDAWYYAKPR